ncbi:MAG: hypothetical protein JST64_14995 [Actinobacteria bacterium]|nr:hypothetical protein [Actinomycetota bacterium]
MAIDEAARLHLYELARSTWDARAADTLMNAIPPDLRRLATEDDLAVLGSDLRSEMADLRGELRSEMADLRGELRSEMADLRGELRSEMADLRGELRSEIQKAAGSTIRTIVLSMVASNATLVGLVFAAVRLG